MAADGYLRYWICSRSGEKPDWETPAKTLFYVARSPDGHKIRIPRILGRWLYANR